MKKRFTFRCGKCQRTFSFQKELTEEQELFFTCPFCQADLVLRLQPFRIRKINVIKGGGAQTDATDWEYAFPDVIVAQVVAE